jgi:vancomycin permeability regulator SanA
VIRHDPALRVKNPGARHRPDDAPPPGDRLVLILLSSAIIAVSGGITLVAVLCWVILVAWRTPSSGSPVVRMLVLGMRLDSSGAAGHAYRARLDRALLLWQQTPCAEIVLLGGCSRPGMPSEAAVGAAYLKTRGVPGGVLLPEIRSRHTLENLLFYRAAFEAVDGALIITSRFHLCRSALLAHRLGIPHRLCAAEPSRLAAFARPWRLVSEAVLVHWYLTVWLFSRLTHPDADAHTAAMIPVRRSWRRPPPTIAETRSMPVDGSDITPGSTGPIDRPPCELPPWESPGCEPTGMARPDIEPTCIEATRIEPTYIVIPAFNEAATIGDIVRQCRAIANLPPPFVVDDGSTDDTARRAAQAGAIVLRNLVNQGKGASLMIGLRAALAANARHIITLDGDGQHRPEDVPRLLARSRQHPGVIIIGSRRADGAMAPRVRYVANRVADFWVSWAARHPVADSQSGFRAYPAGFIRGLANGPALARGFAFESQILIEAGRLGIRTVAVNIPSLYGDLRRPSHFRPVSDSTRIMLLVMGKLLRRGMDPVGLWRSLGAAEIERH